MHFKPKLVFFALGCTFVIVGQVLLNVTSPRVTAQNQATTDNPPAVGIPQLLNYQGYLAEAGVPLNETIEVTFRIYDVPIGGTPLWTETQNVIFTNGAFSVLLGSIDSENNPLPCSVFQGGQTYLAMQVEDDVELQPRQRIVSVAYAMFANEANKLTHPHTHGIAAGYGSSGLITTSDNIDVTVTPGFQAKMIELSIWAEIPGMTTGEGHWYGTKVFVGTEFKYEFGIKESSYQPHGDWAQNAFISSNNSDLRSTNTYCWRITVTIQNITSTTFDVRFTAEKTGSPPDVTINFGWKAWE